MSVVDLRLAVSPIPVSRRRPGWLVGVARFARAKPAGVVGLIILLFLGIVTLFAPLLAPYDPLATGLSRPLAGFSGDHWLGTDSLGRDVLSRLIWGSRTTLLVSIGAVAFGVSLGSFIGLVSGYRLGLFDMVTQRIIDSLLAFPTLVLALVMMATLGSSLPLLIAVIAITLIPLTARVIRGQTLTIKELQYVEAARALGVSTPRLLARHILPAVMPSIIILMTLDLGVVMIVEASLSFLGLGTPPPTPSWGQMLNGAATRYFREAPQLAIVPGLAMSLTVLGVNFLGDAIRDLWDPELRS